MMEQRIEYADRGRSHVEAKRSYLLALINHPTDVQRRAAVKARIKKILAEKPKAQHRSVIKY